MGKRCDSVNNIDINERKIFVCKWYYKKILWYTFVETRNSLMTIKINLKSTKTFLVSCDYDKQIYVVNGFLHASKAVGAEILNCVFPFFVIKLMIKT